MGARKQVNFFNMSNRIVPATYVKSVLQNGVGRYICQLQRLTLKFCKSHAGSRGLRYFIENDLMEFTRANPGTVIYLQPRRHGSAVIVAEYLNGNKQDKSVQFLNREDVCEWVGHLKDRSGEDLKRIMKQQHTDSPSIQGIWTPFTNAPSHLNVASFPSEIDSGCVQNDGTDATQELLGVAKRLRLGATTGRSVSESGSSEASTTS